MIDVAFYDKTGHFELPVQSVPMNDLNPAQTIDKDCWWHHGHNPKRKQRLYATKELQLNKLSAKKKWDQGTVYYYWNTSLSIVNVLSVCTIKILHLAITTVQRNT